MTIQQTVALLHCISGEGQIAAPSTPALIPKVSALQLKLLFKKQYRTYSDETADIQLVYPIVIFTPLRANSAMHFIVLVFFGSM